MSPEEYKNVRIGIIEELAEAILANGKASSQNVLQIAEHEQDDVLSDGTETKGHFLYSAISNKNTIVGYVWFGEITRDYGNVAFIFDIHVFASYRRKGYGSMCLKLIEGEIRENGSNIVELYVLNSNVVAREMYLKQGYMQIRGNEVGAVLQKRLCKNIH